MNKNDLDAFLESINQDITEDLVESDIPADVEFLNKTDASGNQLVKVYFFGPAGDEISVEGSLKIDNKILKRIKA